MKIFDECKADIPDPNAKIPVTLALREDMGSFYLIAVDDKGVMFPSGKLLRIGEDGVKRCQGVNCKLNIKLDGSGRVVSIV